MGQYGCFVFSLPEFGHCCTGHVGWCAHTQKKLTTTRRRTTTIMEREKSLEPLMPRRFQVPLCITSQPSANCSNGGGVSQLRQIEKRYNSRIVAMRHVNENTICLQRTAWYPRAILVTSQKLLANISNSKANIRKATCLISVNA